MRRLFDPFAGDTEYLQVGTPQCLDLGNLHLHESVVVLPALTVAVVLSLPAAVHGSILQVFFCRLYVVAPCIFSSLAAEEAHDDSEEEVGVRL